MQVLLLLSLLVQDTDWTKLRAQLDKLADDDFAVRRSAREITIPKETLLKAPKELRATAALALALLGESKWKDLVVEMTRDPATRAVAFEALGGVKTDARLFIDALTEEPRTAFAAARSLGRLDAARLQRTYDDVDRAMLESRTPERIKRRLACAMGIDPTRLSFVIKKALADADAGVAAAAIVAVAQLEPGFAATLEIGDELKTLRARNDVDAELATALFLRLDFASQEDLAALLRDSSATTRARALAALTPINLEPYDVGRWIDWSAAAPDDVRPTIEGWITKVTGIEKREAWPEWWTKHRYASLFKSAENAVQRGRTFLASQAKGGHWEERTRGSVGLTALALYTLLKCGAKPEDPLIAKALAFLRREELHGESGEGGTYRAAMMALAFAEAKDLKAAGEAAKYLESAQHRDGGWGYHADDKDHADTSNTQMAVMGLRAAANAGIKVAPVVFTRALDWLKRSQMKDGGWAYTKEESYLAMTAAGACAALMARSDAKEVDAAFAWLNEHWVIEGARPVKGQYLYLSVDDDPLSSQLAKGTGSPFVTTNYWLWCLERACMAAGREKVGSHDWYAEGADLLLRRHSRDGRWKGPLGIADHCFAMLFLKRAYVPMASEDK